jgi:hypothetical protein
MGSVVTEEMLKKFGVIQWADYDMYYKACKEDSHLNILARDYVLYRNMLTLFLLLIIVSCASCLFGLLELSKLLKLLAVFVPMSALFYFSIKKHCEKIHKRAVNPKKKTNLRSGDKL